MANPRAVLAALSFLSAPLLLAQPPALTQPELVAKVRALRAATDFRATGRLVHIDASGARTSFPFAMRARAQAGTLKLFCEITDPPSARVRLLIESPAAGPGIIREGHAGDRAVAVVPFDRSAEPLLGTDFSFEDLMENHLLWHNQTLTGQAAYGARRCYVLKSEPGAGDRSHYASVTSWLDVDSLYPVRVEKRLKAPGATKEFVYYGLRRSKGIWSASQIEARTKGKPGSSLLIISRGAEAAHSAAADFDPALLIKP